MTDTENLIRVWLTGYGPELPDGIEPVSEIMRILDSTRAQLTQAQAEVERLTRERDMLASDALAALSAFTTTPEKGYVAEPFCLAWDIERLGRDRIRLRAALTEVEGAGSIGQAWRIARQALEGKAERG